MDAMPVMQRRRPPQQAPDIRQRTKLTRPEHALQLLVRRTLIRFLTRDRGGVDPVDVCAKLYPDDDFLPLLVGKVAAEPARTDVPSWAGDLLTVANLQTSALLDLSGSAFSRLRALSLPFTVSPGSTLPLPLVNPLARGLTAEFVAEGQPIRVAQGVVNIGTARPSKAAVIVTVTNTLLRTSAFNAEQWLRASMLLQSAWTIDSLFLGNAAGPPAGLLNGVTPIPSTGSAEGDISALIAALEALGGGYKPVLVTNPAQLPGLSALFVNGTPLADYVEVVATPGIPVGQLVLLDAAFFSTLAGGSPEFDQTFEALLHMEQTSPQPIVAGGVMAAPAMSLWQQDASATRLLIDVGWAWQSTTPLIAAIVDADWTAAP